jgi:SAM-dependent methyltransferase
LSIDFGRTAEDYARWRAGFPDAFYDRLPSLGRRVLDVGTGTGIVARALLKRGYDVTALDRSRAILEKAPGRRIVGRVEALPVRAFDAVTASMVWTWLDGARAAREIRRALRPGGLLVVAHFDYLPLPGTVVEATEQLITRHNPKGFVGLDYDPHRNAGDHLPTAGFEIVDSFIFEVGVPYTHEGWRGRFRANASIGASLPPDAVARFDAEHAAMLRARFSAEPLSTPHRVCAIIGRRD